MGEQCIWWQCGVFYQIYPRSFMDGSGDGIGDLQGIIDRLDYLAELGVDAIWISPIFASPMADFGYDVSDYTDIHPMFGDMATFDRLLRQAHERGLRIVLDYVPNHTSDQHPWFVESRSSRANPRRDWYIWKDAKPDGSPPNNWVSFFGGSAWEWDQTTGQYYLHLFLKEQPDLNWRNTDVAEAMHDVLRFWLDKGVDGFRIDVAMAMIKHPDFPDNPPVEDGRFGNIDIGLTQLPVYNIAQPEVHDVWRGFRKLFDSYDGDRVTIGELLLPSAAELVRCYGESLDELHLPFNFALLQARWNASEVKQAIADYYAVMPEGAMPNFVLGNHDFHRVATRFGRENHRSAGMLLLTLWGVPTMYYGDELGMEDVAIPRERMQDPWGINSPSPELGRDPERTPMQWDESPNAGFAPEGIETWLPVAGDYQEVNVAVQHEDPTSTLSFYRKLLSLRREMPALHRGEFALVEGVPSDVIAYTRSAGDQRVLVVINFDGNAHSLDLSTVSSSAEVLLSSRFTVFGSVDLEALPVKPHESLLLSLA
jgi:alpha-glucosidase